MDLVEQDEASFVDYFNEGAPEIARCEIQFDTKDKNSLLGQGSYGSVYKGKCRGFPVAVKIPKKALSSEQAEQFRSEIRIMSKLFNPRIALFMGAYVPEDPEKGVIIVSEMLHGDMRTMLTKGRHEKYSLYERMLWAKQAAEGMAWLHGAGVIHRDFKPSNLLWDRNTDSVKVCDFGLSALVSVGAALQDEAKGTPLYVAPELVQGSETTHAADVYSFGVSLSVFITGKTPFGHYDNVKPFFHAICYDEERPKLPSDPLKCPESVAELCEDCWVAEPENRPTFEEILDCFDQNILVDSAVFDPVGRKFWKKCFIHSKDGLLDDVPWSEFVHNFNIVFGSTEIDLCDPEQPYGDVLKELIARRANGKGKFRVKLAHFGATLGFFGKLSTAGIWIREMCALVAKPWFWGECGMDAAGSLLASAPQGAYLVRFSSTPSNYAISFRQGNQVWHTRIKHEYQGQSFVIDTTTNEGEVHDSLQAVVDSMTSMEDSITDPLEGGPFVNFFNDDRAVQGGYAALVLSRQ